MQSPWWRGQRLRTGPTCTSTVTPVKGEGERGLEWRPLQPEGVQTVPAAGGCWSSSPSTSKQKPESPEQRHYTGAGSIPASGNSPPRLQQPPNVFLTPTPQKANKNSPQENQFLHLFLRTGSDEKKSTEKKKTGKRRAGSKFVAAAAWKCTVASTTSRLAKILLNLKSRGCHLTEPVQEVPFAVGEIGAFPRSWSCFLWFSLKVAHQSKP